jgi:DNA-binding transcriptional MerR regulator
MIKKLKMVSAGDIAKELGINKSTVAHYQSIGLIEPVGVAGNMMIFDQEAAMKTMRKITDLKEKGHSLEEIKGLL